MKKKDGAVSIYQLVIFYFCICAGPSLLMEGTLVAGRAQLAGAETCRQSGREAIPLCRLPSIPHTPLVQHSIWKTLRQFHWSIFFLFFLRTQYTHQRSGTTDGITTIGTHQWCDLGVFGIPHLVIKLIISLTSSRPRDANSFCCYAGPKTSSPLIQPMDNGDRHRPHHWNTTTFLGSDTSCFFLIFLFFFFFF